MVARMATTGLEIGDRFGSDSIVQVNVLQYSTVLSIIVRNYIHHGNGCENGNL
jgi:hypothetical protein